jgi:hypothetical protein
MKSVSKSLISCLTTAILGLSGASQATIVTVDSTLTNGYLQVFGTDGAGGPNYDGFVFGSNWGVPALKSTVGASSVVLEANYNCYADVNIDDVDSTTFWRDNGGAGPGGNKWMVASTFASLPNSAFPDQSCNFKASISNYTFSSGYKVRGFIKLFTDDYSQNYQLFSDPLTTNSEINLTADTTGWARIQYGFEVQGLNANPDNSPGSATAIANVVVPPTPLVYGIPNAGFETANGAQWDSSQANGHTFSFPTSGGNPGGYAVIDGSAAWQTYYAVLVANTGKKLSLEALNLTAGQQCTFALDMKILSGSNIGGLKVEFYPGGTNTGEVFPALTGDGSQWSTYSFPMTIPAGTTDIKLVPLWGANSTVAYDNMRLAGPFAASIVTSPTDAIISWPSVTGKTYQVQKSSNLVDWSILGAPVSGDGSTQSKNDPLGPSKSFFKVIETAP